MIIRGKLYDKYMFFLNPEGGNGIPFRTLYEFPDKWSLLVSDRNKGIDFYAGDTKVMSGLFFDDVKINLLSDLNAHEFIYTFENLCNQLIERNNSLKKLYEDRFDEMKQNFIGLMKNFEELVKTFDLPYKYRNVNDIYLLIEYIKNGRVDNWKEAINLLELEKHQQKLLLKLEDLNLTISNLSNIIDRELNSINLQLSNVSNKLTLLNNKMQESTYALKRIMYDTRYNLIWK